MPELLLSLIENKQKTVSSDVINEFSMPTAAQLIAARKLLGFTMEDKLTAEIVKKKCQKIFRAEHPDKIREGGLDGDALITARDILVTFCNYLSAMQSLLAVFEDPNFANLENKLTKAAKLDHRLSNFFLKKEKELKKRFVQPWGLDELSPLTQQKLSKEELAILHLLDNYSLTREYSTYSNVGYLNESRRHSIQLINELGLADFFCAQIRAIVINFKSNPLPENGEACQQQLEFIFTNVCPKDLNLSVKDDKKNLIEQNKVSDKNSVLINKIKEATAKLSFDREDIKKFKALVSNYGKCIDDRLIGAQDIIKAANELALVDGEDENTKALITKIKNAAKEYAVNNASLAELSKNSKILDDSKPLAKIHHGLIAPLQQHAKKLARPNEPSSDEHIKSLQLTKSVMDIRGKLEATIATQISQAKNPVDFKGISQALQGKMKAFETAKIACRDLKHRGHQFASEVYGSVIDETIVKMRVSEITYHRNLVGPFIKGILGSFLTLISAGTLLFSREFTGYFFHSTTAAILDQGTAALEKEAQKAEALADSISPKGMKSGG